MGAMNLTTPSFPSVSLKMSSPLEDCDRAVIPPFLQTGCLISFHWNLDVRLELVLGVNNCCLWWSFVNSVSFIDTQRFSILCVWQVSWRDSYYTDCKEEKGGSSNNLISICFSGQPDLFMGLFHKRMQTKGVSNRLNGASVDGRHCPLSAPPPISLLPLKAKLLSFFPASLRALCCLSTPTSWLYLSSEWRWCLYAHSEHSPLILAHRFWLVTVMLCSR